MGTLREAVNIPLNELESERISWTGKNIVLVSNRGRRAYTGLLSSGSWALLSYILDGGLLLSVLTVIKHLV